ncbi:MAG TPA: lipopolysaccharide biosynthesis protein, partial [Thermotogota bacterium]|nr:lipopolysaccharide biosynthesis protein [Thermotogota bacterium]
MQFVLQVILARLLLPSDFGIIGMITIFVAVSNVFIDSGFTQALIREKEVTQSDYSTVFFFNLLMSAGLYIILFFVSRLISEFFREPQLVAIIKVLSITFIINAFGLIPKTILIKRLDFKTQTKINVLSSVLSGILSILFAISGFGVWSLVAKSLSMQLFQTVFLSLSTRWIPATMFSFSSFRRLFQFGSRLLVAGLINTIYDNVFFVIIGKLFSANDLGYFTQAKKLSDLSSHSITQSLQRVMYPAFSYIKEDNAKLKEVFRKSIKLTSFVSFLLLALLIVSASDIFTLTVGKNWYPSIPYFQVLCLAGLLYPLHALN